MGSFSKKEYDQKRFLEKREFLWSLKRKPCMDCGIEYPPYVMDFDHVRGVKEFPISEGVMKSSIRILLEVAKCDVVCANCHRIRTFTRKLKGGDVE